MKAGRIARLTAFEEGSEGKKGADAADGGNIFPGKKRKKGRMRRKIDDGRRKKIPGPEGKKEQKSRKRKSVWESLHIISRRVE